MKKRRSKAGETLVETLVSVLIAALAFATAAVTAARINAAAREDVSFRYTAEQGKTVTVTAKGAGPGTSQKTGRRNVTLYTTDNGYQYYTDTTSSGVTP
mgnify:CR=1 FL=1